MNAPAPVAPIEQQRLPANQSILRGRVLEVKRTEQSVYTVITLPAPDSYSKPQVVEVRSSRFLGKPNEDVTVRCALGGYRRSYKDSHGETQYATNLFLAAVEEQAMFVFCPSRVDYLPVPVFARQPAGLRPGFESQPHCCLDAPERIPAGSVQRLRGFGPGFPWPVSTGREFPVLA